MVSGEARGKGKHLPLSAPFSGVKLRSESYAIIMKCQMSANADNYDLQTV